MEVDYLKLSEQYASFLVAAGGVSITVLTLVLTLGTGKYGIELRTFLAAALILATICCFTGAHMLSETSSFISNSRLLETKPCCVNSPFLETELSISNSKGTQSGERLFLLAGTNIFIATVLIVFALMLLPAASGRVNVAMIQPLSFAVFLFALIAVLGWMVFTITIRVPRLSGSYSWVVLITVLANGGLAGLLYGWNRKIILVSFILILSLTLFSLGAFTITFNDGGQAHKWELIFFILAVTLSCVSLLGAGIKVLPYMKGTHNFARMNPRVRRSLRCRHARTWLINRRRRHKRKAE